MTVLDAVFLARHPDQTGFSLFGADISGFQGPDSIVPDFDFVIAKATEGQSYDEPAAFAQRDRAIALGKPYGFYHFARPDLHGPEVEAAHFIRAVEALGGPGQVQPGLDCENPGGGAAPMAGDWSGWVLTWLRLVEEGLGVRPEVYTGPSFAGEHFTSDPMLGTYGLWLAHYAGAGQPPWIPWPWAEARVWQFTSTSDQYGHLDLNVARPSLLVNTLAPAPQTGAVTPMAIGGLTDQQAADLEQLRKAGVLTWQSLGSPTDFNAVIGGLDQLMGRHADAVVAQVLAHINDNVVTPTLAKIPTSALFAELERRVLPPTPAAPQPAPAPAPTPAPAPAVAP